MTCPHCSAGYRWKAAVAGKSVTCKKCDQPFIAPAQPGPGLLPEPEEDDGTFELAFSDDQREEFENLGKPAPPPQPALPVDHSGKCPECNSPLKPSAVLCLNCGFNIAQGQKLNTQIAEPTDEPAADDFRPAAGVAAAASAYGHTGPPAPAVDVSTGPEEPVMLSEAEQIRKRAQRDADRAAAAEASHYFLDYKLPVILIAFGVVLALLNILALAPLSPTAQSPDDFFSGDPTYLQIAIRYAVSIVTNVILTSALFFCALLAMVAVLKAAYGSIATVAIKVIGITLIATQVSLALHFSFDIATGGFGILSFIIRWPLYLIVFFSLCWKLLDMDTVDFLVLFIVMVFGRILVLFIAAIAMGSIG